MRRREFLRNCAGVTAALLPVPLLAASAKPGYVTNAELDAWYSGKLPRLPGSVIISTRWHEGVLYQKIAPEITRWENIKISDDSTLCIDDPEKPAFMEAGPFFM